MRESADVIDNGGIVRAAAAHGLLSLLPSLSPSHRQLANLNLEGNSNSQIREAGSERGKRGERGRERRGRR